MSYQVLARKWRPQQFDDVIGQPAVTRTLANAIKSGRIAQSFVFAGPRGVGKTTTARILARALNCDKGPTAQPCGQCDACREIAQGERLQPERDLRRRVAIEHHDAVESQRHQISFRTRRMMSSTAESPSCSASMYQNACG